MMPTPILYNAIQWKRRKRHRSIVAESMPRWHYPGATGVIFCVLIGLIQCTVGQTGYYKSCFDQVRRADDNSDALLSREEYIKFLVTISGGAVLLHNETPPILSNPYTLRLKTDTQQLDIRGVNTSSSIEAQLEMESFCRQIYSGLVSIFSIKVEMKACTTAFRTFDSNPQNGTLSSEEYTFFVVSISKDVSLVNLDFEELPSAIKDVFGDMSEDGGISESLGDEYLLEFCERSTIASKIGEVVYASMPTEAPTIAPITRSPTKAITPTPTNSPIASTNQVSSSPTEEYSQCKTALIISDLNRNSFLDSGEYGNFLEELSDNEISANDFINLDTIFQDTFTQLLHANDDAINLSGFRPGLTPTTVEYQNLIRICNETYIAITMYEVSTPSLSPAVDSSNSTKTSETDLKSCKKYLVLSDGNRNSVLDESEFITFVSRSTATQDFSSYDFSELDVSLQVIYKGKASSFGGIDIDGSKPGQQPTMVQENHLEQVCADVYNAIDQLEAKGPATKVPTVQSSPSQAPFHKEKPIEDDFFRVCKTAMLIADRNRDDFLEAEEYVRFLNRLTISEFSGEVFANLEAVLQNGFLNVAIDNKIDVYGSKPGTTPSTNETDHLRHVCKSVFNAIEGYQIGNTTTPPNNNCQAKLVDADGTFDNELNTSEYVVFLRSFADFNYTNFDTLPYLLRNQYDWLSLGKSTINIAGLANNSIQLQGDKIRISWICERTSKALDLVKAIGNYSNLTDHCDAAIKIADNNTDGLLDAAEFYDLTSTFTLGKWDGHNLSTVNTLFQDSFDNFKNAEHNLVDVEVAKSEGLCQILANATNTGRESETLFQICSASLKLSDTDRNGRLNQTEYIPFIDNLVTAYNLTISSAGDVKGLKSNLTGIDIGGLASSSSAEEFNNLHRVCMTTGYVFGIINYTDTEKITIYNSFLISNEAGLEAKHLIPESAARLGLDKAYDSFVDYEVKAASKMQGRFLMLQAATLIESHVYQIIDSVCPDGYDMELNCQTVFAFFNLTVATDEDPITDTISSISNKTQDAIDRGVLQLMLATVDPNSTISVIESSLPVQPEIKVGDNLETIVEPIKEIKKPREDANYVSFGAIVGAAVGASIIGAVLFYLFVSRQTRSKSSTTNEKEVIEVDDISAMKASSCLNENSLEEGNISGVIYAEENEMYGFSDTNNTFLCNVSPEFCSVFKSSDESDSNCDPEIVTDGHFGSESNSRIIEIDHSSSDNVATRPDNENLSFKINDESVNKYDTGYVTHDDIENRGNDQFISYTAAPCVLNTPEGATISSDHSSFEKVYNHTDFGSDNDESGSFDEVEVDSDEDEIDEIQSYVTDETKTTMCPKNIATTFDFNTDITNDNVPKDKYDESFIIEEYSDASDEEIEISVHDDEENEEISEIMSRFDSTNSGGEKKEIPDEDVEDEVKDRCVSTGGENVVSVVELDSVDKTTKDEKVYSLYMIGVVKDKDQTDIPNAVHDEIEIDDAKHLIRKDITDEDEDSEVSEETWESEEEVSANEEISESEEEVSANEETSESEEDGSIDDNGSSQSSDMDDDEEILPPDPEEADKLTRSYNKYRPIIVELIRQVMPDEIDNVDTMMEQFIGNEKELVTTLRNMACIEDSDDDDVGSDTTSQNDDSETTGSDDEDKAKITTKGDVDTSEEEDESDDDDEGAESKESDASESDVEEEEDKAKITTKVDADTSEEEDESDDDDEVAEVEESDASESDDEEEDTSEEEGEFDDDDKVVESEESDDSESDDEEDDDKASEEEEEDDDDDEEESESNNEIVQKVNESDESGEDDDSSDYESD